MIGGFQSTRPRGARRASRARRAWRPCFNPRARVGRDAARRPVPGRGAFQSTRPRGARRSRREEGGGKACFNPRARVGRDGALPRGGGGADVSIHAPAWGATPAFSTAPSNSLVSIHAPAWGATLELQARYVKLMFQSTRPRGARRQLVR